MRSFAPRFRGRQSVIRYLPVAACLALLTACSPAKPQAEFSPGLDMIELMAHVVDPAAFQLWRGAGTEVTEAGERDLSPTTEEGWKVVEDGAATLAEAGNLLMLPGRPRAPEADWNRHAKLLTVRALEAKAAAKAKDKQAVFDTGGRVYEVCTACHAQFVIAPQEAAEAKK